MSAEPISPARRHSGPLPGRSHQLRYLISIIALVIAAAAVVFLTMAWDNPLPFGTEGFWIISKMRVSALGVIAVVAVAQSVATIAFQTVTNNRILTPSILGFESLYRVIQTGMVFLLGAAGVTFLSGQLQFVLQVLIMVIFACLLYGFLLTGKRADLHVTLLVGLVLGGGLASLSTFMQRLLDPAEFDLLLARQIASVGNADVGKLGLAIPAVVVCSVVLYALSGRLNVLALGRDTAVNLGLHHQRFTILVLVLVAILVSVSTALIGPMTFFGFLVAMLTYQLADTYDHKLLFPMGALLAFVVFGGAYFVLKHVFPAEGSVSIIIELVGGIAFLVYILRKGRLA
ncbi:MAG: iron chelate uptake ABC transporter family permease subunit [Galactobacter sp.]|uniref:iron chelate uptake ABC transporter family permease subunit n=1 Tax=Galactobacter sp. TaxID=2676125 RepID=UPI0025BEB2F9|nr:iron chelate uptake ABC transporter family permease subunit [Galactobacter sp.]